MSHSRSFVPAAPPPEGVIPDFEHPEDVWYSANLVTVAVCLGVVNSAFALHVYVKLVVKRARLLHEDGFCLAAWLFVNSFLATTVWMAVNGEGYQVWEISLDEYKTFLKALYVNSCFYSPAAFCTKATLLLLIARVFAVRPLISKAIHIFILAVLLAYIPIVFLKIFTCRPVSAYWEMPQMAGVSGNNPYCLDQARFFMGDIVIAVITDFLILILPIPLAWIMEAPRRQKIKIMILLGAGGAATATTVMRVYFNANFYHSTNVTNDFTLSSISSVLELSIGLLCACLPSVNLLVEKAVAHLSSVMSQTITDEARRVPLHATDDTSHSYWSSLKSKIALTTVRTIPTTVRMDDESQHHHHHSQSLHHQYGRWRSSRAGEDYNDIELGGSGNQHTPVVFNNRLDVPSIRSSSDNHSRRSSKFEDYRGQREAMDSAFDDDEDESARRPCDDNDDEISAVGCAGRSSWDGASRASEPLERVSAGRGKAVVNDVCPWEN